MATIGLQKKNNFFFFVPSFPLNATKNKGSRPGTYPHQTFFCTEISFGFDIFCFLVAQSIATEVCSEANASLDVDARLTAAEACRNLYEAM